MGGTSTISVPPRTLKWNEIELNIRDSYDKERNFILS